MFTHSGQLFLILNYDATNKEGGHIKNGHPLLRKKAKLCIVYLTTNLRIMVSLPSIVMRKV